VRIVWPPWRPARLHSTDAGLRRYPEQLCGGRTEHRHTLGVAQTRRVEDVVHGGLCPRIGIVGAQDDLTRPGLRRQEEWQAAAAGTPDDAISCNINTGQVESTDARATTCVSNWGVVNMVGNLFEWVADWMQDRSRVDNGDTSRALYGHDIIAGIDEAFPERDRFPAALYRGGHFVDDTGAGVFALYANDSPSHSRDNPGFRCAR
jgi:Sulfatase-modifying factor enzyme 1